MVEQINFHRQMADRLSQLYHDCWPNVTSAENLPADLAATTTIQAGGGTAPDALNPWESNDTYEEV